MRRYTYKDFRAAGYTAQHALRAAKIVERWNALEGAGLVRLGQDAEQDDYFDVFGEPDGYTDGNGKRVSAEQERQDLLDSFERDGLWIVYGEYSTLGDGAWHMADSVGMCAGYRDALDPLENWYVPDIMQSTISALEAARREALATLQG